MESLRLPAELDMDMLSTGGGGDLLLGLLWAILKFEGTDELVDIFICRDLYQL